MSDKDIKNTFTSKPIEQVKTDVHIINRNINKIKTDIITMKADLSIIKDYIRKKENEMRESEQSLKGGWWFT
jgi:predicted  nucleic acid-binding Zn-ribbon protein